MLPWEGRCPGGWGQKTKSCLRDSEKPLIYFVKIMFIDRSPGPCPSEASPDGTVWWTRSRQGQPQDSMHLRANESATLEPVGSDQLVNIPGQGQQRFFQEDEATKLISNKPKLYFLLAEEERGKEAMCEDSAFVVSSGSPNPGTAASWDTENSRRQEGSQARPYSICSLWMCPGFFPSFKAKTD